MFAVLFGLSMDYEVFLISAIRERYLRGHDNSAAVRGGVADTGRVISSAALIMVAIFASFVIYPDPVVKMFGLGLAVAVAVDATIVRGILVPSTMVLLGRVNWWIPGWLDRILPHFDIHPEPADSGPPAASPR
jgi:RND superfamily putative drug exporter